MDWMLHKVHMVYVRQKLFRHIDVPLHAFHAVHCTVYMTGLVSMRRYRLFLGQCALCSLVESPPSRSKKCIGFGELWVNLR